MNDEGSTSREKRQLFRFVPDVTTGTLLQMALLASVCITAYGTYTADRAKDHMEVEQIKKDAEQQRAVVKEALGDLKGDVKDIQRTLVDVKESLAAIKARPDPQPQPQDNRARRAP